TRSINYIEFRRLNYKKHPATSEEVIDYKYKDSKLTLYCSPETLRPAVISVLSIKEARDELEECRSRIDAISVLDKWLKDVFTETLLDKLGETPAQTNIKLKNIELTPFQSDKETSEYRKSLGMLIYVFKAIDFLSIEDDENESRFKLKQDFTETRDAFADTI